MDEEDDREEHQARHELKASAVVDLASAVEQVPKLT